MNLPKDLEVGTGSLPAADLARRWWCRPGGECAVRLVGLHAGGSASTPALIQGSASTPARGDKTGRRHRATQRPDPCNASTPALTQGSAQGGKGGGQGGGQGGKGGGQGGDRGGGKNRKAGKGDKGGGLGGGQDAG